jgi:hypothetical protein
LLRLPQGKEKGVEGGRRGGDVECGMWNVERRCKGGAEAKKRVERVRESRVEDRAWMVICSLFAPLLPLSSSLSLSLSNANARLHSKLTCRRIGWDQLQHDMTCVEAKRERQDIML